jgi:hypothetical protein
MQKTDFKGEVYIMKERQKDRTSTIKKRKKKEDVREYDPEKDESRLLIGGYSSYIKKKEVTA